MELKNLLNKLNQQTEEKKLFLAIEISSEVVKSAVWEVVNKKTEVVTVGTIEEWKGDSPDELLTAVDTSLTKALEKVDKEPNEVIFGLPETWVGSDGIAESKKSFLKEITQKLELKPVGFVVTTEAVVHYLQAKEGGPPTALLLYLTETEVGITLVELGRILGTQAVGRSDDLGKDVEEGLARFSDREQLPARMLLYDGNIDLEAAKQILISYDWQERLPFLHFPKVESLERDATIRSVAVAGGAEVARSLGFTVSKIEETERQEVVADKKSAGESGSVKEKVVKGKIPDKTEEFGFTTTTKAGVEAKTSTENELKQEEELGQGKAEASAGKKSKEVFTLDDHEVTVKAGVDEEEVAVEEPPKPSLVGRMRGALGGFAGRLRVFKMPKLSTGPLGKLPPMAVIGGGLLLLVFIVGLVAYWNVPEAKVTVYLNPQSIEKEVEFKLNDSLAILDADNKLVPAREESVSVEGNRETATTGEKLVGERAKGKVKVYNRTLSTKTFEAGATIQVDSYAFSLDEEITIASASTQENADFSTTIVPSTEEVTVTANDIGDDYNFSDGTQLTVESFAESSFVATAMGDFEGGFSREIQAVSEEDIEGLLSDLTEELKQKAVEQVSVESDNQKGVVQLDETEIVTEEFSAEEDDEVETLNLRLEIALPIYTYQIADLRLLLEKQYADEFPDNFVLSDESVEAEVIEAEVNDDGVVEVKSRVTIKLLPKLDADEIAKNIRGKYPELTQDYFASLPNFSRVETEFSVSLPSRLSTFPRKVNNIQVEVKIEEE